MRSLWQRVRDFWTVPRFVALLVAVSAIFAIKFIATKPYTGPVNVTQAKATALLGAGYAYLQEQDEPNSAHIAVTASVTNMRQYFQDEGQPARVVAHGANIMVTFPNQPAVCISMPDINGTLEHPASLASC
jgi:hypothetical protein